MSQTLAILVLTAAGSMGAAHDLNNKLRGKGFLVSNMHPELVAHTLVSVMDEWKAQAYSFADCNATAENALACSAAPEAFKRSCTTVAQAIVSGSSGDRDVAKEYMSFICDQQELASSHWKQQQCLDLQDQISKTMLDNTYENRMNFDAQKLCSVFWTKFEEEEQVRVEKEAAEHAEKEKKAAAERAEVEKKAAEERAEAEKKAAEEAALAKKKAEEEAKRKAEEEAKLAAAKAAAEAKAKLAEAAARLAAKKTEAEEIARAAKEKMEEAAAVEREHRELLAKSNAHMSAHDVQLPSVDQKANGTQREAVAAETAPAASKTTSNTSTATAAPAKSATESPVDKKTS